MNEEGTRLLQEIASNTRDIVTWLQVAHGSALKEKIEALLDSGSKRIVYQYSDGQHSTRALAELAGVGDKAVRGWWREWAAHDVVEVSDVEGRFKRKFDLARVGIEVPRAGTPGR